jgi:uncharacterized membrane protein
VKGARFAGQPVHPALVHFPLALWSASWVWDLLGAWTGSTVWWETGFWCLVAGSVMALPAAVTGLMDLAALERTPAEDTAMRHMLTMGGAFAAYVTALMLRAGTAPPEGWRLYTGLALSSAGLALLALGGWYGRRMVYEYGAGRSTEPPGRPG